jgi:hypothetical protein
VCACGSQTKTQGAACTRACLHMQTCGKKNKLSVCVGGLPRRTRVATLVLSSLEKKLTEKKWLKEYKTKQGQSCATVQCYVRKASSQLGVQNQNQSCSSPILQLVQPERNMVPANYLVLNSLKKAR